MMKTLQQFDDMVVMTTNELVLDADGDVLFEEVTCETGTFPALRLATNDGEFVDEKG